MASKEELVLYPDNDKKINVQAIKAVPKVSSEYMNTIKGIEGRILTGRSHHNCKNLKGYIKRLDRLEASRKNFSFKSGDRKRLFSLFLLWDEKVGEVIEKLINNDALHRRLSKNEGKLRKWFGKTVNQALVNETVSDNVQKLEIHSGTGWVYVKARLNAVMDARNQKSFQPYLTEVLKEYYAGNIQNDKLEEVLVKMVEQAAGTIDYNTNQALYDQDIVKIKTAVIEQGTVFFKGVEEELQKIAIGEFRIAMATPDFWADLKIKQGRYFFGDNADTMVTPTNKIKKKLDHQLDTHHHQKRVPAKNKQKEIIDKLSMPIQKLFQAAENPLDYASQKFLNTYRYGEGMGAFPINNLVKMGNLQIPPLTGKRPMFLLSKANYTNQMVEAIQEITTLDASNRDVYAAYAEFIGMISPLSNPYIFDGWNNAMKDYLLNQMTANYNLDLRAVVVDANDSNLTAILTEFKEAVEKFLGDAELFPNQKILMLREYVEKRGIGDYIAEMPKLNIGGKITEVAKATGSVLVEFYHGVVDAYDPVDKLKKTYKPIGYLNNLVSLIRTWTNNNEKTLKDDDEVDFDSVYTKMFEDGYNLDNVAGDLFNMFSATLTAGTGIYKLVDSCKKIKLSYNLLVKSRASKKRMTKANEDNPGKLHALKLAIKNEARKLVMSIIGVLKALASILETICLILGITFGIAVILKTIKVTISSLQNIYRFSRAVYKTVKGTRGVERNKAAITIVNDAFLGVSYATDFIRTAKVWSHDELLVLMGVNLANSAEKEDLALFAKLRTIENTKNADNSNYLNVKAMLEELIFKALSAW